MFDEKITNSCFKLIFFFRPCVSWNYILVPLFDGEREKEVGGGRKGNKLMLGLYHDCVKDKVGQIHNLSLPRENLKIQKADLVNISQNVLLHRLLKCSDEKLKFWRPLLFLGVVDLGLILVLFVQFWSICNKCDSLKKISRGKRNCKNGINIWQFVSYNVGCLHIYVDIAVYADVKKRVPHWEFAWEWMFAWEFTVVHSLGSRSMLQSLHLFARCYCQT